MLNHCFIINYLSEMPPLIVFSLMCTACSFLLSCLSARMQKPSSNKYSATMLITRANVSGDRFNLLKK